MARQVYRFPFLKVDLAQFLKPPQELVVPPKAPNTVTKKEGCSIQNETKGPDPSRTDSHSQTCTAEILKEMMKEPPTDSTKWAATLRTFFLCCINFVGGNVTPPRTPF